MLILTVVIIVFICSIVAYRKIKKKKYIKFVLNNSIALKDLNIINNKYEFYKPSCTFDDSHVYDNEIFYNSISCEDYLIYQLQYKKHNVVKEMLNINSNKPKYTSYCEEINQIQQFGRYIKNSNNLNINYLLPLEKKIFEQNKLKPKTNFTIHINLYCSKINGDVYSKKSQIFSSEEINHLIKRLNNKNRNFYNDNEIWNSICRVERGRVSNKMRFAIYKRDHYRCKLCGKSDTFDYLEIDHIKPIAKGGKSTYDNLQTLCRRCNKEKGDKY